MILNFELAKQTKCTKIILTFLTNFLWKIAKNRAILTFFGYSAIGHLDRIFGTEYSADFDRIFGRIFGIRSYTTFQGEQNNFINSSMFTKCHFKVCISYSFFLLHQRPIFVGNEMACFRNHMFKKPKCFRIIGKRVYFFNLATLWCWCPSLRFMKSRAENTYVDLAFDRISDKLS